MFGKRGWFALAFGVLLHLLDQWSRVEFVRDKLSEAWNHPGWPQWTATGRTMIAAIAGSSWLVAGILVSGFALILWDQRRARRRSAAAEASLGLAALAQPTDDMRPFDWDTIDGLDERLGELAARAAQVSADATLETNTALVDATTTLLRFATSRQSRIDTATWDLLQALWETCGTLGHLAVLPERRDDPETIRHWVCATARKRQAVVDRLAAIRATHGGR